MTVHVSRDFPSITTGYPSGGGLNMNFTPYLYCMAIFMHRVLGYSIVGNTGFDLDGYNNQSSTASSGTNIAAASGGQFLPQSTINVGSTTGFPASGQMWVATSSGFQIVRYSGTTGTTFTNCTGGVGLMTAGQSTTIAAGSNGASLPQATINVASTTGFATSGTIYVITTNGPQAVTYTNTNATQFTGCSGGTGTMNTGNSVSSAGGTVVCGQNKILSASGNPWTITTNLPHGLSDGQYVHIAPGGTIPTGIAFSPYPARVINSTQFQLVGSVGGSGYTANSQTFFPTGMLVASGTNASINFGGAPSVYAVQVETSGRTVVSGTAPSTGDVGRILVLKSNLYPTKNSGVFKISTVNTATNSYTIDYRSTDTPPPESGMSWWIYEVENQVGNYILQTDGNRTNTSVTAATNTTPIQITCNPNTVTNLMSGQRVTISGVGGNTNANGTWFITVNGFNTFLLNGSSGNANYTSGGSVSRAGFTAGLLSFNSHILLQSPHSTGWQVRLSVDPYNVSTAAYSSIAVGYGGTSSGDFTVNGPSTLITQFTDTNMSTTSYPNMVPGSSNQSQSPRMTMIGDDGGRALFCYTRTQSLGSNGITMFGLPDNEPTPLPININRPFIYGGVVNSSNDYGGIQMRHGSSNNIGMSFRDLAPEVVGIAGFVDANGVSGTSPVYSGNAGDCPFTGTTEVVPWEVWGGTATNIGLTLPYSDLTVTNLNQRFMGTAPFIRQGRTNFGAFTLSTDSTATSTVSGATNTSPIQITTLAANALTTGQTVVITGVTGNTAANGTFTITVIDNTHFTLDGSTGNGTYAGSGTVQGTARWLHLQNGIYMQWNGCSGLNV